MEAALTILQTCPLVKDIRHMEDEVHGESILKKNGLKMNLI